MTSNPARHRADLMTTDDLLGQLQADAAALAGAASVAGLDTKVEHLDWTVREVVAHVGGVHRWAADVVGERRTSTDTELGRAVGTTAPDDAELLDWFTAGAAFLLETLRATPAGVSLPTFLPAASPLEFWVRRQAHETAIHRVDVESAAGDVTPFATRFAEDGLAELLLGFAARRSNRLDRAATMALRSDDGPSWTVRFGGERTQAERADAADADLVVAGTSSDLYLWLWNRPSAARLQGDDSLARAWADTVQVRWT
ncbi:MAG: maleylpyruvate isomerase family mycothiol-dependent enzyme [Jatrophihabitans sp.]|uniref:maleylpyruvate isomerase family mycothiol-dependent enzyme n=1 Tax=Jatrophihabitans sp. TaxID=1932789 RepID=UPI003F813C86